MVALQPNQNLSVKIREGTCDFKLKASHTADYINTIKKTCYTDYDHDTMILKCTRGRLDNERLPDAYFDAGGLTMRNYGKLLVCAGVLWMTVLPAEEESLNIMPDTASISFDSHEGLITLRRFSNDIMLVEGVIRPMVPTPGVTPVGELEVIAALQDPAYIVVDAYRGDPVRWNHSR